VQSAKKARDRSRAFCILERCYSLLRSRLWQLRLGLFLEDQLVALVRHLAQAREHAAGAGRDQAADDDVFLEAIKGVDLALGCGIGEDPRRFLERPKN
jgi:hypothetical protein